MSDTPRTDAAEFYCEEYFTVGLVDADFARELERENDRLQDELSDWIQIAQRRANKLADMREVLEWLVDLQNGCPLPKYEKVWERTMQQARVLLGGSNNQNTPYPQKSPQESPNDPQSA